MVYSFFRLMEESLGSRAAVVRICEEKGGAARFLPPWSWVLPASLRWPMGELFVWRCERGVFQYVFLRVACAMVALFAELGGALCEGWAHPGSCVAPYINGIIVISQAVAMYCLVMFYHELAEELAPLRALEKLLAVKAVVFLSFFQGVVLILLIYEGVITATNSFSVTDLSASLQNFLICWEMALAAVIHHFIFSRRDFKSGALPGGARINLGAAFLASMPHDVMAEGARVGSEVTDQLRGVASKVAAAAKSVAVGGRGGGEKHREGEGEGGGAVEWHATPIRGRDPAAPSAHASGGEDSRAVHTPV